MPWYLVALIPSFLFAACNYIDKFVVSKIFPETGAGAFILSTSVVSATMAVIALTLAPEALHVEPMRALAIALLGAVYLLAMIPYIIALSGANTSQVAPLFQLRHGVVLVLAFFILNEFPSASQIIGMVLVCGGVIVVSVDPSKASPLKSLRVPLLMVISSTLLAVYAVMFKYLQLNTGFWPTKFWEYVGETSVALSFAFSPKARVPLVKVWRVYRVKMLLPLGGTELLNVIGVLMYTYALTVGPAALVSTFAGIHPVVVIIYGVILGRSTSLYSAERSSTRQLLTKAIGVIAIMIGCVMMGSQG